MPCILRSYSTSIRRTVYTSVRLCVLSLLFLILNPTAFGQSLHWVGSWTAAPCGAVSRDARESQFNLHAQTVRQIVHLSVGGTSLRLRLSNEFGAGSLTLRSVHVALPMGMSAVDGATDQPVTVSGHKEFTIRAGISVWTDPIALAAKDGSDVAVSFFVPGSVTAPAIHYAALQTSYTASGDQADATEMQAASKITIRLILTGVDVSGGVSQGALVAIGSSTTDGIHSTPEANRRWTDDLYTRLRRKLGPNAPAVLNEGISGNRVLHDGRGKYGPAQGEAAISRFKRDVLDQSGIRYVIVFEGGNDIRMPSDGSVSSQETVSAAQLIAGFRTMAQQSHHRNVKFLVGTVTPFEFADPKRQAMFPEWEKVRLEFNEWVRNTKEIDGVVDFDAAIRDPDHPARILAEYDSGDDLHPNDAGYQAMADSVNINLFDKD